MSTKRQDGEDKTEKMIPSPSQDVGEGGAIKTLDEEQAEGDVKGGGGGEAEVAMVGVSLAGLLI